MEVAIFVVGIVVMILGSLYLGGLIIFHMGFRRAGKEIPKIFADVLARVEGEKI